MSRYFRMFSRLRAAGEGAFVPFVMLGDPTPELSEEVVEALIDGGADALELGAPFSDPVADGPTIQRAHIRALEAGAGFADASSWLDGVLPAEVSLSSSSFSSVSLVAEAEVLPEAAELEVSEPRVS